MPEGDAVWFTARRLDQAFAGKTLTVTDFRVPQLATVDLTGQVVHATATRGKHLLTRIGDDWTLHTHLKMEGEWKIFAPDQRWNRPAHAARVVLANADATGVGFSLGIVELIPRSAEAEAFAYLGPDLLGDDWDEGEAVRRISEHADETIFDAVRDQRNFAGLGTIWAAETLFSVGVHPLTPVGDVTNLTKLVRMAKLKLGQAISPKRPLMAVYGRGRAACRRCGTPVARLETSDERPIYFCPHCQPSA